jgi:magnesium transporter
MSKRRRTKRKPRMTHLPPGSAPGTLIPAPDAEKTTLHIIAYGPDGLEEKELKDAGEIRKFIGKWPVIWLNVEGLGSADVVKEVGEIFNIHHLALEDVLNVHERAKIERYNDDLFLVMHMMEFKDHLEQEQLSVFSGKHFAVTFQEGPIDTLDPARERIRKNQGHIRKLGSDYLIYSIIDSVLDNYFPILETYGELLDKLEDEIITKPSHEVVANVHAVKRELLTLRRAVWPLREAINTLIRDMEVTFSEETRIHLRDCYDHAVRIIDFIETYRELAADLMDVYLSSLSNRMNEVMKVLTIITTLFVPPTLIAGIYGMNFNTEVSPYNMPELNWFFGYPFALFLMLALTSGVVILLWYKGWLGVLSRKSSEN